jgi:hypothetical protein
LFRTALAVSTLVSLACPSITAARAPAQGETIAADWTFEPSFTVGDTLTRDYSDFHIGRLVPKILWRTDSAVVSEKGKQLIDRQALLLTMSNQSTFCEPKRPVGSHDVTCFVDSDSDGRIDGFFRYSPAEDMTQVIKVNKIRPLAEPVALTRLAEPDPLANFDVAFRLARSQLDIAQPSIFGQFCIQADRIDFLNGIYGKTRENCTYNSNQELSIQPLVFGRFGYKFTILDVQNETVTFRIDTIE